jgi:hypothetical protein
MILYASCDAGGLVVHRSTDAQSDRVLVVGGQSEGIRFACGSEWGKHAYSKSRRMWRRWNTHPGTHGSRQSKARR